MKTLKELLLCVEDDIELMGLSHIIYLMEQDGQTVDYDYLPSELYTEAVTLKELQDELLQRTMAERTGRWDVQTETPDNAVSSSCHMTDGQSNGVRIAVFFPGIGYTCDKPLLYFSEKLARKHSYETFPVRYGHLSKNCRENQKCHAGSIIDMRGNTEAMTQAFDSAMAQAEEILHEIDWSHYSEILFISKSIGTLVASSYAQKHGLSVRHIFYTPLIETFSHIIPGQIAFHGTCDPWADTEKVQALSRETDTLLFVTPEANHSLETGDIQADLQTLQTVMKQTEQYMLL